MTEPDSPGWLDTPQPDVSHEAARLAIRQALEALAEQVEQMQVVLGRLNTVTNSVNTVALGAEGVAPGDPWRAPSGAHDAYPAGWTVTFGGKTWESLTPANVGRPGVSGWREVVAGSAPPPAWVQPSGAHDAYPAGALVSHGGRIWRSTLPANVWEPGVAGWQLQEVTP